MFMPDVSGDVLRRLAGGFSVLVDVWLGIRDVHVALE